MSVNRPRWRHGAAALALLLSACSGGTRPPATPSPSNYAAVARGRVDVEGGLILLGVAGEGTIRSIAAREGQTVRRGEALLELDSTAAQLAVEAADADLGRARAEVKVLAGQLEAASTRARRLSAAARAGAGEGQAADDAQATAAQLTSQREVALAVVAAAAVKRAAAQHELTLRTLRAPQDAEVVRVAAQPGTAVSPQSQALITLLPLTPRIIRAELSEAYASQVKAQMAATVSAEDDPDQAWSARVQRISTVVGPSLLEEDSQRRAAIRTVECVLTLDSQAPLRVGQRVLVRFGAATAAAKD